MTTSSITHEAHSVSDFIQKVKDLPALTDAFYTYRGESNVGWPIAPGIMRARYAKLLENERDAVRDIVSVHPNEFLDDRTMFDRLVRMQHFGLPTRLMDVTANPLVALFNATNPHKDDSGVPTDGLVYYINIPDERRKYFDSDTVSCVANLANLRSDEKAELLRNKNAAIEYFNDPKKVPSADRLVQFVRAEKPSFRPRVVPSELDMLWYVVPKLSNRRIIAQNGAFLLFGLTVKPPVPSTLTPVSFKAIKIPKGSKAAIREDLLTLGITESALFPEIDKAAKFIVEKYE